LLDVTNQQIDQRNYTLPKQNPHEARAVFKVEGPEFEHALEDLKNKTELMEKFNLGLYQNGHIDLGYLNEADLLNPEQGENFQQLHCLYKDRSWLGKAKQFIEYFKGLVWNQMMYLFSFEVITIHSLYLLQFMLILFVIRSN
jgi:hypothetical protein